MIFIKRPPIPAFLTIPNNKWQLETEEAIKHYSGDYTESFKFEMYNDSKLKEELKKVFVKCAYCESNYAAVYDGDVEHFRPKGRIKEKKPQIPGYYWLANDWDNLFLACQHCNQRRKHILYGEDLLEGYGKLDQFPLSNEKKRITKHNKKLDDEESVRLLINPCKDDPSSHIAYEDKEAVIVPLSKMGEKSVEVYVLQRPYLVQERKKQMLLLFKQIDRVKRALKNLNENNNLEQKKVFEEELEELLYYTKLETPYAGMSRFFVKKFLHENNIL